MNEAFANRAQELICRERDCQGSLLATQRFIYLEPPLQFLTEQYLTSWAIDVPILEQVPAGQATPLFAHTPPEQLPLPFMIPAKAAVDRTELKNTNDNAVTKIFNSNSSLQRSKRARTQL